MEGKNPNSESAEPSATETHGWRQFIIRKYAEKVILQLFLIPVIPFIYVLIQSILLPGPVYCDDNSCPERKNPYIPDAALLPIVLVLYSYCVLLAVLILSGSGSWMKDAVKYKLIAFITLFLLIGSVFQLVPPAAYRGYVLTYYSVQNYKFEITKKKVTLKQTYEYLIIGAIILSLKKCQKS